MFGVGYFFNFAKNLLPKWPTQEASLPKTEKIPNQDTILAVKNILTRKWSEYENTLSIDSDDLEAGIFLFTKVALNTMQQPTYQTKGLQETKFSAVTEVTDANVEKVQAFALEKAYVFRDICKTGFPFSHLENKRATIALKNSLENRCKTTIVYNFLIVSREWMIEEELNREFAHHFRNLELHAIKEACYALMLDYQKGDNRAGYYFLWLVKYAADCSFVIPEKNSFHSKTVSKLLSQFIESPNCRNPANLIEILCFQGSEEQPIYIGFLNQSCGNIFMNFVVDELERITMQQWPNKPEFITTFLETITPGSRLIVAKRMAQSQDAATATIGHHITAALTAHNYNKAIIHFNALQELLPHFNYYLAIKIFDRPFIETFLDNFCHAEFPFVKTVRMNVKKLWVFDSLLICVFKKQEIPPYLFAFDINTKKLVWGIPLVFAPLTNEWQSNYSNLYETENFRLKLRGNHLFLQFHGEKNVQFINAKTGQIDTVFQLPEVPKQPKQLHIDSSEFVYLLAEKDDRNVLIGGRVTEGQWNQSFAVAYPRGRFQPLSTHCGAFNQIERELIIFGPTGAFFTIKNCLAAQAREDKLYVIEVDPNNPNKSLLKVRTLLLDQNVVSPVEKVISLEAEKVSFGELCKNGQWVLFHEQLLRKTLIFVAMNSGEVIYSYQPPIDSQQFIQIETGEVWSWDQASTEIVKVSATHVAVMGRMTGGFSTRILHVDREDQLYRKL